jgi:hypothetical protein
VFELGSCLLAFRMHGKTDRSALHVNDRLVPVSPIGCCGQADNISCFDLVQDSLKRNRRQVMALINNN